MIGFWLAARRLRLPRRRRAVPHRAAGGRRHGRPARVPARHQALPAAAQQRGRAARRGQPALSISSSSTSAATRGGELDLQFDFMSMQAMYLSLVRSDPAPLIRTLTARPAIAARDGVGELRAQPRRAHARQADRKQNAGGVRGLSPPTSRSASTTAASPGACRRCSPAIPAASAWSTACCSRCPACPCSSTARRSGWARTPRSRGASPCARRCSGADGKNGGFSTRGAPRGCLAPIPTDGYAPRHVNVHRPAQRRRTRCCTSSGTSRRATGSRPRSAGASSRCCDRMPPVVLAHSLRADVGRMIALHNFADVPVRVRFELGAVEEGAALLDLHGPERIAVEPRGRVELELPPYGHRWLRVSPPETAGSAEPRPSDRSSSCARDPRREVRDRDRPSRHRRRVRCRSPRRPHSAPGRGPGTPAAPRSSRAPTRLPPARRDTR